MKHMEEIKIAGLAMALYRDAGNLYCRPKDGTVSHLTAIPDNNAAEPVTTDSTSEEPHECDFPIYTERTLHSSELESSGNTGDEKFLTREENDL